MRRLILFVCILTLACSLPSRILRPTPLSPPYAATTTSQTGTSTLVETAVPAPTASMPPAATLAVDTTAFHAQVDAALARYPGDWHILVEPVGGSVLYSRQASSSIDVASVIKIPIAMLFFKSLEGQNLPPLKQYLAAKGIDGRTYEQLLHAMLVDSEEPATFSLLKALEDSRMDVQGTLRGWGAANTNVILRKSTVEDIVTLIDGLYAHELLQPEARDIVLGYMAEYTSADDTRTGVIRKLLPCGGQFYNKRGTITAEYLAVADVALIQFPSPTGERAYVIALFAYPGGDRNITYESLVGGMQALTPIFWQAIRTQSALRDAAGCGNP